MSHSGINIGRTLRVCFLFNGASASDFGLLSVCLLCLWPTRSPMVSNDGAHEDCNNNSKRCFWGCRYWTMGMGVQNGLLNDMKGEVDDFVLPRLSSGSVLIF